MSLRLPAKRRRLRLRELRSWGMALASPTRRASPKVFLLPQLPVGGWS
jgi:hypothetical protein